MSGSGGRSHGAGRHTADPSGVAPSGVLLVFSFRLIAHGQSASPDDCSRGRARCDDDLRDQYLRNAGVALAAPTDAGCVEMRLVKVAGLAI